MTKRTPRTNQARTDAHPLSPVIGLATMLLAFALLVLSAQPPPPKPITAPENEFSAARAMAVLDRLLGDGAPHPLASAANAQVGARIGAEMTALGYTVEKSVDTILGPDPTRNNQTALICERGNQNRYRINATSLKIPQTIQTILP